MEILFPTHAWTTAAFTIKTHKDYHALSQCSFTPLLCLSLICLSQLNILNFITMSELKVFDLCNNVFFPLAVFAWDCVLSSFQIRVQCFTFQYLNSMCCLDRKFSPMESLTFTLPPLFPTLDCIVALLDTFKTSSSEFPLWLSGNESD